jgi:hypothetical protein
MTAPLRHLLLWFTMVMGIFHVSCVNAADALPEYTIKAGYLYNFALLTEWPPSSIGTSLELCYFGYEGVGTALESLQNKVVNNRRINIRRLDEPSTVKECHVLFISEMERLDAPKIMREIVGRSILTVTDDESLARAGITIFLRPERHRLVFEINAEAAKTANLNISARLLRLARTTVNE